MISIALESCDVKVYEERHKKLAEEINDFTEEIFSDSNISLEEAVHQVLEASRWRFG